MHTHFYATAIIILYISIYLMLKSQKKIPLILIHRALSMSVCLLSSEHRSLSRFLLRVENSGKLEIKVQISLLSIRDQTDDHI